MIAEVTNVNSELNKAKNKGKIVIMSTGLCFHLGSGFEPQDYSPKNPCEAECQICNKKWRYSTISRKFIQI